MNARNDVVMNLNEFPCNALLLVTGYWLNLNECPPFEECHCNVVMNALTTGYWYVWQWNALL